MRVTGFVVTPHRRPDPWLAVLAGGVLTWTLGDMAARAFAVFVLMRMA